jgi:hypothetical protein
MASPQRSLPNRKEWALATFDLWYLGTKQHLHWELAGWRGFARAERLIGGRVVLVMKLGGALGLTR